MITRMLKWIIWQLLVACVCLACVSTIAAQKQSKTQKAQSDAEKPAPPTPEGEIIGKRIQLSDGSTIQADEVWQSGGDLWYRIGGVTQRVSSVIRSVEPIRKEVPKTVDKSSGVGAQGDSSKPAEPESFWILLKGGARMKVDEVTQSDDGVWYRRGNFSMLLDRDRIDRIETESALAKQTGWKRRDWSSGIDRIDALIRANGSRFAVDPYLIFCVMEHESHFRATAVSPKGALGLMQLMPATARRFGVTKPFDPAQNIYGGTQYLKELLTMFSGRLDLALASYNAGEGAVIKYGGNVPPYRETREYVKKLTRRYGAEAKSSDDKTSTTPQ